jgi:tetratricopeptide (TPR) repeat protein
VSDKDQPPADVGQTRTSGPESGEGSAAPGGGRVEVRRLGDFDLLQEIGRGGMGVVFEARQLSLNRRVALKVLPAGLGLTEQAIRRFDREARAAAKLHHTNIVPVYATGEDAGSHYYAMELVEGGSLADIVRDLSSGDSVPLFDAPLTDTANDSGSGRSSAGTTTSDGTPPPRGRFEVAARLIAEVAEALEYAHGRGIIHRDIKPANLLVSEGGRLRITDFGLARIAQEPGMTVSGSFLGTPAYMSPEQIAAGRIALDHRTDIYSLGSVLYELITLQRAFPGESRDKVLTGIMTREPPSPRKLDSKIPVDLDTICLKAIEKDPERRYQTAGELAQDLRRFLAHGLIAARRAGPLRRAAKFVQRHPVSAVIVVAALLIGGIGTVAWRMSVARTEQTLQTVLADARFAMSQGTYRDALAKADRALRLDPDLQEARAIRARALIQMSRPDDAIAEGRALLANDPEDWVGHAIIIHAAKSGGLYDGDLEVHGAEVERLAPETPDAYTLRSMLMDSSEQALVLLERALDLDPASVFALEARAYRHVERMDLQSALIDGDRLITARPRSGRGRRVKATAYRWLHDSAGAHKEIERAIALDPEDPINYFLRGTVYQFVDSDLTNALADFKRATEMDPEAIPFLLELCGAQLGAGDYGELLKTAVAIRALDPERPESTINEGWAYLSLGDSERVAETLDRLEEQAAGYSNPELAGQAYAAVRDLAIEFEQLERSWAAANRAVEVEPDNWEHRLGRARVWKLQGNEEEFRRDCASAADLEETEVSPLATRSWRLHVVCQDSDLAMRDASLVIERAPWYADGYQARGLVRFTYGDLEGAVADHDNAIERAPRWDNPHSNRRILLMRLGRYEDALNDADTLIRITPGSVAGYWARAEILVELGRFDEGVDAFRRVMEIAEYKAPFKVLNEAIRAWQGVPCAQVAEGLREAAEEGGAVPDFRVTLAWVHFQVLRLRCPDLYDPETSLADAGRMVELDPSRETSQMIYGEALYWTGRHEEAVDPLEFAALKYGRHHPRTSFLQAMNEWKLGRKAEARVHWEHGASWMKRTGATGPFFLSLRDEAAELMGLPVAR